MRASRNASPQTVAQDDQWSAGARSGSHRAAASAQIGSHAAAIPPLVEMSAEQRREFQEALLDGDDFKDLPRTWQAAILRRSRAGRNCALVSGT